MASRFLVASSSLVKSLSRISLNHALDKRPPTADWRIRNAVTPTTTVRWLSGEDDEGGDSTKDDPASGARLDDDGQENVGPSEDVPPESLQDSATVHLAGDAERELSDHEDDDDPFGVRFVNGTEKVGPPENLPPKYIRDSTTGRLTGEIEQELSDEDKRILNADPYEMEKLLLNRVERHWKKSGPAAELNKLGRRIRDTDMGLNVLGRSGRAQSTAEELDDGSKLARDDAGFSQKLTKKEFETFAAYMKQQYKVDVNEEDVPVQEEESSEENRKGGRYDARRRGQVDPDDPSLALKWLTLRGQRQMDDMLDDNPYSDLMPGDVTPSRLVNRRQAKRIPVKILHHNNIDLLKLFLTPTGQIQNRVQSRLGARDQRRVKRIIKRARCLGLIPFVGPFKAERHGWVYAKDINEERPWEREIRERGLVIKRKQNSEESSAGGDGPEKSSSEAVTSNPSP